MNTPNSLFKESNIHDCALPIPNATDVVKTNSELVKTIMDTTKRLSSYLFGMGETMNDAPNATSNPSCFMEELNDQTLMLKITMTELENICSRIGL